MVWLKSFLLSTGPLSSMTISSPVGDFPPGGQGALIGASSCARSVAAPRAHGCICRCSNFLAEACRVHAHPPLAAPQIVCQLHAHAVVAALVPSCSSLFSSRLASPFRSISRLLSCHTPWAPTPQAQQRWPSRLRLQAWCWQFPRPRLVQHPQSNAPLVSAPARSTGPRLCPRLHTSSFVAYLSRFLVQHSAKVSSQNNFGWITLHTCSVAPFTG